MINYAFNAMTLSKAQAAFLLDCISYADKNHPRVDPKAMEKFGEGLVMVLQEIVGGE
jgi:hypothetical protein